MDPADTQNFDECFLAMDTGFIDAEEDAEDAARLRNSGKEPDKPFDEQGRDVFADYGFSGNHARPDDDESDEQDIEEEGEAAVEQHDEAGADNGSIIDHGELQQAGAITERREESSESANSSPSTDDNISRFRSDVDNDHDGYETGLTSASVTDDDQSKHTKEASGHLRVLSSGLASLAEDTTEEYSSQTSLRNEKRADDTETAHERSTSPRMSLEYTGTRSLAAKYRVQFCPLLSPLSLSFTQGSVPGGLLSRGSHLDFDAVLHRLRSHIVRLDGARPSVKRTIRLRISSVTTLSRSAASSVLDGLGGSGCSAMWIALGWEVPWLCVVLSWSSFSAEATYSSGIPALL